MPTELSLSLIRESSLALLSLFDAEEKLQGDRPFPRQQLLIHSVHKECLLVYFREFEYLLKTPVIGHPGIVWNPREKSCTEHRLMENPRVKGNTVCRDRRLKLSGLPPFLNSSGSSSVSYTCTLAEVQPSLRNKSADDTWILQDRQPSWKEERCVSLQGILGRVLMKKQDIGQWVQSNFLLFFLLESVFYSLKYLHWCIVL